MTFLSDQFLNLKELVIQWMPPHLVYNMYILSDRLVGNCELQNGKLFVNENVKKKMCRAG